MVLSIEILRHSLEHVMVLAIQRVCGGQIRLGVGPVIDSGFYQDCGVQIGIEKFPEIESEMHRIIDADLPFVREEVSIDEACEYFAAQNQDLKVALLRDIAAKGSSRQDGVAEREDVSDLQSRGQVSLYSVGEHRDLCRGPHVPSSGSLKGVAFKLDRVAGAYWRGDERNEMLCRVYGLAFSSEAALGDFLHQREEAVRRDHRKVGDALNLFFFHDSAPGMPYWLPNGLKLKNLLLRYWREYHEVRGYQEIAAPILNRKELWEISGHLEHYKDNMFFSEPSPGEAWALKPMNCANAMIVWKHRPRSYRELPLRLSDCDVLHRNERGGGLSGLFRCRCFCQDDSHNFIAEEQIEPEIGSILKIVHDFYSAFGLLENMKLYLSGRPVGFIGEVARWEIAEQKLEQVLQDSGLPYGFKPGDGAFYGPKIDIHLRDALGREWQCGTIQLDFQLPIRFDLEYADKDGSRKRPVVIHRVIFGSVERFIGILVEHFDGRLPFWIAPEQIRIIPVHERNAAYAESVAESLRKQKLDKPLGYNFFRVAVDSRNESLGRRIREAEILRVPVVGVVGDNEQGKHSVNVRIGRRKLDIDLERVEKMVAESI